MLGKRGRRKIVISFIVIKYVHNNRPIDMGRFREYQKMQYAIQMQKIVKNISIVKIFNIAVTRSFNIKMITL